MFTKMHHRFMLEAKIDQSWEVQRTFWAALKPLNTQAEALLGDTRQLMSFYEMTTRQRVCLKENERLRDEEGGIYILRSVSQEEGGYARTILQQVSS